jgi:ParB family transcriptional regulator, chromosome partitioning protein
VRTRLGSYLKATELVEMVPTKLVVGSRHPLREDLGDLGSLAASIKKNGLLEPIIVRPLDSKFEIVAGHRRFEACRKNRFHEIPAIVMDITDRQAYGISLEENLQRKTLDPIEEARSFKLYVDKFGYGSVTELAEIIGKSEEYVSHRIMLLGLPPEVIDQVRRRLLSTSEAWEISRVKDGVIQTKMAELAINEGSTVRELRALATMVNSAAGKAEGAAQAAFERRSKDDGKERRSEKIRKAAVSTLKVAMIRIDDLVRSSGDEPEDVRAGLMKLRLSIHDMIGRFGAGEEDMEAPTKEIADLIRGRFVNYFNEGRVSEIAKMRSRDRFSIFDDYPLNLMDLSQSLKHDLSVVRATKWRECSVEDLKVHLFEGGDGAVATFLFVQRHGRKGRLYRWRSRVSFVLERRNSAWSIVHEHWSEADPVETVIKSVRELNKTSHRRAPEPLISFKR